MELVKDSIVVGKITKITDFGIFVEIGKGLFGLVHISEISNSFVENINELFKVGDEVKTKVLDCSDLKKISLSIKKAEKPVAKKVRKQNTEFNTFEGIKKEKPQTFEDMMTKFKQSSEEKFSQLNRKNKEKRRPRRSSK